MAAAVTETSALERIVAWIRQARVQEHDPAEVSVSIMYRTGPQELGMTELEVREQVNEGLRQRILGLAGLADVIRVVEEK